jgi:hypothetical protein
VNQLGILDCAVAELHGQAPSGLYQLAFNYEVNGETVKAKSLYRMALRLWEAIPGTLDWSGPLSMHNLAEILADERCYLEAESLYLKSLGIWHATLG